MRIGMKLNGQSSLKGLSDIETMRIWSYVDETFFVVNEDW